MHYFHLYRDKIEVKRKTNLRVGNFFTLQKRTLQSHGQREKGSKKKKGQIIVTEDEKFEKREEFSFHFPFFFFLVSQNAHIYAETQRVV